MSVATYVVLRFDCVYKDVHCVLESAVLEQLAEPSGLFFPLQYDLDHDVLLKAG